MSRTYQSAVSEGYITALPDSRLMWRSFGANNRGKTSVIEAMRSSSVVIA